MRHLLAAAGLLCLLTRDAGAQAAINGTVVDPDGVRLSGALVELWLGGDRQASTMTGEDGRFKFAVSAQPMAILIVRRIGYRPERAAVTADSLTVVLKPVAVLLAPLSTTAKPRCPQQDDPDARALWTAMSHHYRRPAGLLMSANAVLAQMHVRAEDLGRVDTTQYLPAQIGRVPAAGDLSTRPTYASRPAGFTPQWFDYWQYAHLESVDAYHFTDTLFGVFNTMRVESRGASGATISFCGRRLPRIEGSLVIGPDTTIASAEWVFRTEPPVEHAGGRVIFSAYDLSHRPDLALALSGMFWRRRALDYIQLWWEFRGWTVSTKR